MPDRRDFVTRARRHQTAEWGRGAAKMANGIELDRIQTRRKQMSDEERSRERLKAEADDAAERRRLDARAARRAKIKPRCEVCEVAGASTSVDGVLVCEGCWHELA